MKHPVRSVVFWLGPAILLLAACAPVSQRPAGTVTDEPPASATPSTSAGGLSVLAIQRVLELFDLADQALSDKRLTSPETDNAWRHYLEVLAIQPGNREARQGLVNIVERYIQWSDTAVQQGRLDQARHYLARAALVQADHAGLEDARARLSRLGTQSERYFPLDADALQRQDVVLKQRLAGVADQVRAADARVVIEVPSDRLGRWVYQQLNGRHEDYRIRANIRLQSQPGIRLLH